jgi:hypothetical protein
MICKECGNEIKMVNIPFVDNNIRANGICLECERWLNLFDEIQINKGHFTMNGKYWIIDPKSKNEVYSSNKFCFKKDGVDEILYSNTIVCVGKIPARFSNLFPTDCGRSVGE